MHQLLHRHLFFSLLALCLLFVTPALAQNCPATITVQGQTSLCRGESTTLVANPGFTYQWYQDGNPLGSPTTNNTRQVTESGRYKVEVSGGTCDTEESAEVQITVNERPIKPDFTLNPNTVACSGTPVTFTVDAPEEGVNYIWDMGNGDTSPRGASITYTYEDVRGINFESFTVKVFGRSATTGCQSEEATRNVQVNRLPELSFTEKDNFNTCLPDTIADEDISVTAEISNTTQEPYLSDIRSYTVTWGDGSAQQTYAPSDFPISNPTPFTEIGDYEIVITALAGNGCRETFTQTYSVSKKPEAKFSLDDKKRAVETQQPPCVPVIVTPTDSSSGGGLTYKWDVVQGPPNGWVLESGSLEEADPVFRFTESGVYEVQLIVENSCGVDTASQSIVVGWPQLQLPQGGVFCGQTTIDFSSSGAAGGGGGGNAMFIDKNLGENLTGNITITGPKSTTFRFNSDVFTFKFDFDVPGRYLITAEAINECGSSNAIYQGQPPPPVEVIILRQPAVPTIQQPGIVCEGESVTLTPTGPGPLYAWFESNDPTAQPIDITPSFTTPPLAGGATTYFVAAVDTAQGVICVGPMREINIQVNPRIANNTIEGDDTRNVCIGGTLAELRGSTPTGGNDTPAYTWLRSTSGPASGFDTAPGVNNTQHYTPPGAITTNTWFRRMVRSASCEPDTSAAVAIVVVEPVPLASNTVTTATPTVCIGDPEPVLLVGSRPAGGAGEPYTFMWEIRSGGANAAFGAAPAPNTGENYSFQPAQTGEFWFRRRVISGGCTSDPSEPVQVIVNPRPPTPTLTVRDARACEGGSTDLTIANPNPAFTYRWYDVASGGTHLFEGTTFTTPPVFQNTTFYAEAVNANACASSTRTSVAVTIVRPVADAGPDVTIVQGRTTEFRASGGATYQWTPATGLSNPNISNPVARPDVTTTYTVRVTTAEGCEDEDELTVTVTPAIRVPNAFSPNGDMIHDDWEIENIAEYPDVRVEVFNRWGNKIFSSTGYRERWDGKQDGKDLPVATYYYVIYLNSSERPISGNVTIVR